LDSDNSNNKYEINIGFGQEYIEKNFKIIYQYMRANSKAHENFCDNISSQKYLLSIVQWHLSYGYYLIGHLKQAFNSAKEAYLLDSKNLNITYNYCILSLKIFGKNTYEKIAYEWKECRTNNRNIESPNEANFKKLDYWVEEIIKCHHK